MNNQRALATIGVATMIALAIPGIAAAHDGTASGTCNGGVSWSYSHYDKTVVNTITVTIDGQVRYHDGDFKSSDAGQIATDKTKPHTWDVLVDAPGTQWDRHPSGSYAACVTVTTTTVPSSTTVVGTTTVPPTTSVPDVATTVVTDPTTTSVAVDVPPVPTTVALGVATPDPGLVPVEPVLPRTGGGQLVAWLAAFVVVLGVAVAFGARRGT